MPVERIGKRRVIETGAFVIPDGERSADIWFAGGGVRVQLDANLAAAATTASHAPSNVHDEDGQLAVLNMGPLETGQVAVVTTGVQLGNNTYALTLSILPVQDDARRHHQFTYSITV